MNRAVSSKGSRGAFSLLLRRAVLFPSFLVFIFLIAGCSIFRATPQLGDAEGFVGRLVWPVHSHVVVSQFGRRGFFTHTHQGIDIKAEEGAFVHAAHDGIVVYSSNYLNGYGNMVVIRSGAIETRYAHNEQNFVKKGEFVLEGQRIARAGMTGNATGPHLHFETRILTDENEFRPVDPMNFFPDA